MGRLAVVALAQPRKQIRHDQQSRWSCEQQAADDRSRQCGVLLLTGAADCHGDHADDHCRRGHQHWTNPGIAGGDRGIERRPAGHLLLAREGNQ